MKKFGLIGHPIAHSLSPALFKAAYDGKYAYDLIEGEDFETSYRRFIEEYDAINVTAPFKEAAFAKADILSEECASTGATNLLVKTPEGIKAYNSDFLGVRMWLSEVTEDLKGVKILIVGLGGAGKAAAAAAESLGMDVIRMNRTVRDSQTHPLDDFRKCFRKADIVIYNIPAAIPELKELTATTHNPEDDIINQQEYDKWLTNIEKLKDDYKAVAKMNLIDNFGYKEIADELGLPLNTVKTKIRRAKAQLLKMMDYSDELL